VVASQRGNSFGPFHSLKAIVAPIGHKSVYSPYERPPFPIIIDTPTVSDLVSSWRFSDFVMGGTIYGTGILWGYVASRPFTSLSQRLIAYHSVSHIFFALAVVTMVSVPYRRLTGYWDNGLRWRRPADKLRKYDNTSEFEKASIWGRLRPSEK